MPVHSMTYWCAAGWLLAAAPALAADASAGRALFRERCSVCHTAESGDSGGAQGPSLIGIMGRPAASAPQFSYTTALRDSKLAWDARNSEAVSGRPHPHGARHLDGARACPLKPIATN